MPERHCLWLTFVCDDGPLLLLCPQALTHLSTYCKALSTLDLSHVHALSSAALVSFFTSASCARGLEEVVLSRVDQVIS